MPNSISLLRQTPASAFSSETESRNLNSSVSNIAEEIVAQASGAFGTDQVTMANLEDRAHDQLQQVEALTSVMQALEEQIYFLQQYFYKEPNPSDQQAIENLHILDNDDSGSTVYCGSLDSLSLSHCDSASVDSLSLSLSHCDGASVDSLSLSLSHCDGASVDSLSLSLSHCDSASVDSLSHDGLSLSSLGNSKEPNPSDQQAIENLHILDNDDNSSTVNCGSLGSPNSLSLSYSEDSNEVISG